jgi:hypothetical protein
VRPILNYIIIGPLVGIIVAILCVLPICIADAFNSPVIDAALRFLGLVLLFVFTAHLIGFVPSLTTWILTDILNYKLSGLTLYFSSALAGFTVVAGIQIALKELDYPLIVFGVAVLLGAIPSFICAYISYKQPNETLFTFNNKNT